LRPEKVFRKEVDAVWHDERAPNWSQTLWGRYIVGLSTIFFSTFGVRDLANTVIALVRMQSIYYPPLIEIFSNNMELLLWSVPGSG
jgi:hypothetical protein